MGLFSRQWLFRRCSQVPKRLVATSDQVFTWSIYCLSYLKNDVSGNTAHLTYLLGTYMILTRLSSMLVLSKSSYWRTLQLCIEIDIIIYPIGHYASALCVTKRVVKMWTNALLYLVLGAGDGTFYTVSTDKNHYVFHWSFDHIFTFSSIFIGKTFVSTRA